MTSYIVNLLQCPRCTCRFTSWVVRSCNTLGAKFYTDGYVDGSMYDEGSQLLACPGCHTFMWREDVSVVQSVRDAKYFEDKTLQELPPAIGVHARQYEEILCMKLWRSEAQEKYIRMRAWWSFNRGYRGEIDGCSDPETVRQRLHAIVREVDSDQIDISIVKEMACERLEQDEAARQKFAETYLTLDMSPPRDLPPDQTANLDRLLELLDSGNAHEVILRAEALRELGRFDECLLVLDHASDESLNRAAIQIRQLAMQKKRRVELLA